MKLSELSFSIQFHQDLIVRPICSLELWSPIKMHTHIQARYGYRNCSLFIWLLVQLPVTFMNFSEFMSWHYQVLFISFLLQQILSP